MSIRLDNLHKLHYIIVVIANNSHLGGLYLRKLKIILSSLLIAVMLGSAGFGIYYFSKPSKDAKVIATIFPIYDIAREIMGGTDDLMLLEDNGVDIHNFSPSAQDMTAIHKSELFIYIGGESDDWVGSVLKSCNNPNLITLQLLDEIEKLEESEEGILQGEEEEEHHHEEGEEKHYDEHIWLSIKNVIVMTERIRDNLSLVFPERKEIFRINADRYIDKLKALDAEYTEYCSNKTDTIIVADRFPFLYLMNDYGIKYHACFSGCSTETQASADTISTLIDKINVCDVDYILVLETSDQSVANSALSDTRCKSGVGIEVINSCQSVSLKDVENYSYLGIMQSNLEVLKKVLTK